MDTKIIDKIKHDEFIRLTNLMYDRYGIRLSEHKKILIVSRLASHIQSLGLKNFHDYIDYILDDKTGQALMTLVNKLTTNLTYFLREEKHFQYMKSTILPWILAKERDKDIRIWSAGCSSGEEPYTIVMLIEEILGFKRTEYNYQVLATDISNRVLEKAKSGIYEKDQLKNLPATWMRNNFNKLDDNTYQVIPRIRDMVIFRQFNLKREKFPFKRKFHIIFCRNVMIYFDGPMKADLVSKYYDFTESGGYLLIGHSESIDKNVTKYRYIQPAIYRKEI